MKKILKHLIFLVFLFFINTIDVNAYIQDECLAKNECMVLCNYVTNPKSEPKNLTIYYFFDNTYKINWQKKNQESTTVNSKGPSSFVSIFSDMGTNVFHKVDYYNSSNDFRCPDYGYLDFDNYSPNNEICFDNNQTSCEGISNIGTAFGSKADGYEGQIKNYDFEDQLKEYSSKLFNELKADVESGAFDLENLNEKISGDFNKMFNGQPIPNFIKNNAFYKYKIKNDLEGLVNNKLDEIEQAYSEGRLTEEEYNTQATNWDVDVKAQFESSQLDLKESFNQPQTCKSIFGSVSDPNEPAYWIQLTLDVMKYIAIAALIILSIIDFIKALVDQDNDAVQKALKTSFKRLIFTVILFFIPIIIEALFNIFGFYEIAECSELIK